MHWFHARPKAVILLYHRVARIHPDPWSLCVTPEHFQEHLQVLQRYRRTRIDRIASGKSSGGHPPVAVTFDDGYADNSQNARPLLERYDTPATFFITTGAIDSQVEFWWDELEKLTLRPDTSFDRYLEKYQQLQPLSHLARSHELEQMCHGDDRACRPTHRTLTCAELKKLASSELFEIGAHTVTHPLLAAQPDEVQRWELISSKKWLEAFLDRPVTSMSYPYGGSHHYNRATVAAAEQAGYLRACTTVPQTVHNRSSPWELGRFTVSDMGGDEFQKFLLSSAPS